MRKVLEPSENPIRKKSKHAREIRKIPLTVNSGHTKKMQRTWGVGLLVVVSPV
jgi:hypothetical protein